MTLAMAMTQTGGPEVLKAIDVEVPAPGPLDVRIKQSVIGVNFVDTYFRSGLYPVASLPAVIGFEGAGIVEAVGGEVARLRPGDRVAYTGAPIGAYAESRLLPESRLVRIPDALSFETAGSSMLRGLTAHMLLHNVHPTKRGDWILVHAAAGGLGQIVVRWAKRLGANVIGTVGSPGKIDLARAAGADHVLLHTDPHWTDDAVRVAERRGVHLAIDGIGGSMVAQTLRVVRPFGVVASLGQPAGPIPPVRVEDLGFARSIALMRPSSLAYADDPDLYARGTSDLLDVLVDGMVGPIGARYALTDAARAHAELEAGRTTGSVILTV
ncbi:quinone oxidoreductase family protein [Burkholderia oklahomensis]|uniref:quinone oxidoreductase family protein n=1 Tax=Burkholderia oklahomensis TaxID=342113 RepID=UPI000474411E|nr:quinone oxidoreductase [Burkholderia oklahomensis]AJX32442.1 zinc-binding dehydrogenase family protein [Burkholderia oklahomensis C6786]AOI45146.1 alcohol dehydrogenase [Burkholderia oklahomensis C6786]KUY47765.1 alcohol dehydrogenase [Burkholderia oklahomensis C6786]MBI0358796.1 quinone oxidoreductase [Burkholderia oklahomensis]SUW57250.1 Quinone oxidoreductase 1 [Burkholderia oklahomensis]